MKSLQRKETHYKEKHGVVVLWEIFPQDLHGGLQLFSIEASQVTHKTENDLTDFLPSILPKMTENYSHPGGCIEVDSLYTMDTL